MYRWYEGADICYAYLSDVVTGDINPYCMYNGAMLQCFKASKWFTRGWTLQELIAPRSVEFYAEDWTDLGTKSYHREEISAITGISGRVLDGGDPSICNVAERFVLGCLQTNDQDRGCCILPSRNFPSSRAPSIRRGRTCARSPPRGDLKDDRGLYFSHSGFIRRLFSSL
jgi:hypothetical protein